MKHLIVLALVLLIAGIVFADSVPDTPENRQKQARRYLQATPPKALLEDIANKMAAAGSDHEKVIHMLMSQLDFDALTQAMTNAIVKHFTAEEIKAMADFYGSPVWQVCNEQIWRLHS